ncbi:MAG: MFS transporter [Acidimicrobiia bacterium]|nr:MFS transporter [Acidimicrobiia bacterium]
MTTATISELEASCDPSEVFGWKMYDWGWSAHTTTVLTALLGPYLLALAEDKGGVDLFRWTIDPGSYFPYAVSLAAIVQVIGLPLVGTVADHTGAKKTLLMSTAYAACAFTAALFFVTESTLLLGGVLFVLGAIAFAAAGVVYNSYLPDIVPPQLRDRVSADGYAFGYVGGGLYLALNFALIALMDDTELAVRISLGGAGVWAAVFIALFTHRRLKQRLPARTKPEGRGWLGFSLSGVTSTGRELWTRYPVTFRYLIAYIIFNDGIQTVIAISTSFAAEELDAEAETLLLLVLMIQFAAVPGAMGFGRWAERSGAKKALTVNLLVWAVLVVYAYAQLDSIPKLWAMGVVLAFVLGGSQAIARSLFSQMIPNDKEAEYFGFYEIASRGTTWIGPLVFGIVNQIAGSQRQAIISLILFFVIGIAVLVTVDVRRGMSDAGNNPDLVKI